MNQKKLHWIVLFSLIFSSQTTKAQETVLTDRITGFTAAATNNLNNQTAGAGGGRQVLFTQVVVSVPTTITRVRQLSNSNVTGASVFEYAIRSPNPPYTLLETGPAILESRTVYTDVTSAGNNSNLDDFTLASSSLNPGTYYLSVYASDGNGYQLLSNSTGPTEPLLAENGGVPFLAGANFHMFISHFGMASSSSATAVPALPLSGLIFLGSLLTIIAYRAKKINKLVR